MERERIERGEKENERLCATTPLSLAGVLKYVDCQNLGPGRREGERGRGKRRKGEGMNAHRV